MFYRPRSRNPKSNRHAETIDIGQALKEMLSESRMDNKYLQVRAIQLWEEIMGKTVAARTEKAFMKSGILFIKLNSAPLKNELYHSRELIKERINQELGEELIQELTLL